MAKPKGGSIFNKTKTVDPIVNTETSTKKYTELDEHIKDNTIHVDQILRDNINYARKDIESHVNNEDVHVSKNDRATWNAKETPEGAQSKVNKVLNTLDIHKNDSTIHLTKGEKELFKDKYTKAETRNLVKHTFTGLNFLPAVKSRTELSIKYPNPEFNTCIKVQGKQMIFNGTEWIEFDGIFTPEVTEENDGLMSMDDKKKLDSIENNANYYIHPDDVDNRHVSDAEKDYWNKKADNVLATVINDGLMSVQDKQKLDAIEENAKNYVHPETHEASMIEEDETHRFVTDEQIKAWDSMPGKDYVDKTSNDILSTTKSLIETKVAGFLNTSEPLLEVLRSLSFEFKKDTIVSKFFELFNSCAKKEEFEEHVLNDKIHMSRSDVSLLQNVKAELEKGLNPDWLEKDTTSTRYIENKPEKLPANGGNADTVENNTVDDIINKTIEWFDTTILKSDSKIITENEIDLIANRSGSTIIFRPDTYPIERELIFRTSNKIFKGISNISKLTGASIRIIGNNNVIEDLCFSNGKDTIVNNTAIIIEGDNNIIRNNTITNYNKGIVIEGSNNTVYHNTLSNIRNEAIQLVADINSNYGNIIDSNRVNKSNIGIALNSSKNLLTKNKITKNNILNCSIGVVLSNKINDNGKTTMNIISENIIMRGNGNTSDYSPTHKTIVSEFSSKNIINCNIVSGKQIIAPYDILSNNIE